MARFATILPLDYGARIENSVIYFSDQWSDLIDLLEVPLEVLRTHQLNWPQPGNTIRHCWQLRRPVTAIIESARKNVNTKLKLASFGEARLREQANKEGGDAKVRHDAFRARYAAAADPIGSGVLDEMIDEEFPDGAFFAEFAIETSVLMVRYYKPKRFADAARGFTDIPTRRFAKPMTVPTLGHVTGAMGSFGTLHLDLGVCPCQTQGDPTQMADARDRAQFIVDCIESRAEFARGISQGEQFKEPTQLVPENQSIATASNPVQAKTGRFATVAPDGDEPTIIAQGLSDQICCVCINTCVFEKPDGTFELGDMLVKNYCCTP